MQRGPKKFHIVVRRERRVVHSHNLIAPQIVIKTAKSVSIHKDIYKNGRVAFFIQTSGSLVQARITKKKRLNIQRLFVGRYTYSVLL